MHHKIIRSVLAAVIIASAVIVSWFSPLNERYAPSAWAAVALGTILCLPLYSRHWLRLPDLARFTFLAVTGPWENTTRRRLGFLDLALLSQIAAATTQILVAINLPSPHLALHNIPGITLIYLLLAALMAWIVTHLALSWRERGRCWAALLGAGLFSSTLYLRSFAVPEAGPVYGPVIAFALIAAYLFFISPYRDKHVTRPISQIFLWGSLFLVAVAMAVLFSPVPGQSLDAWIRLVVLMGLTVILASSIHTPRSWKTAAWVIVIIAGLLPFLLAVNKLLNLGPLFGWPAAISARFHATELGGANLIARSVLSVVPLALALNPAHLLLAFFTQRMGYSPNIASRLSGLTTFLIVTASLFVMLYTRSWDGLFGWLAALGAYGLLLLWHNPRPFQQYVAAIRLPRWLIIGSALSLSLIFLLAALYLAPRLNTYSFNGRLIHWHGAILAWFDQPWVGSGPGNEIAYTPYAGQVGLFFDTQIVQDDPLTAISINAGNPLKLHAHNILLGIGSNTGILGLISFIGLLAALFRLGFMAMADRNKQPGSSMSSQWIAACLAGLVGELAWGVLDILTITPPFFSFPVWGLIGLLLAAAWRPNEAKQQIKTGRWKVGATLQRWSTVALAALLVLIPALAARAYAAGFVALQEQRWAEAVANLEQAAVYAPLNTQMLELLATTYLAQGKMTAAQQTYEHASALKVGYSPYASQLGWLAWLQGDLNRAAGYFQQAVAQDPGETWRKGLHADLGLAYVAQGRFAEAIPLFKETLELNPQLATALYWQPAQRPDGRFDVVLDPVYTGGPSPELGKRIKAHLGVANITNRLFAYQELVKSPLSLNQVLDAVEVDYRLAETDHSPQAPLLLAALAEASRLAGLTNRAGQAYLEFQALRPNSAYGFRDLALLYSQQDRPDEAQIFLERAVTVSPDDISSRYNLALVYLDQKQWSAARQALEMLTSQSLVTLFRSQLFDPDLYTAWATLYQAQGDSERVAAALRQIAFIRAEPADYLTLANLYDAPEQAQQAATYCVQAAAALGRRWPRPLDGTLWGVGECLGLAGDEEVKAAALAEQSPFIAQVLQGHIYRAQKQFDQALNAYQYAAELRPDEGDLHYFLGDIYQGFGQPEAAATEYRQAAALNPHESLPLLALGRMQWDRGEQEAGLLSFRAAVAATPGWGQTRLILGNALLTMGNQQGAAIHFQQAQHLDGGVRENSWFDFSGQLAAAQVETPGVKYIQNDYFTIDGQQRRVLYMHPDSQARYVVNLPDGLDSSPKTETLLAFDIATSPDSWEQPGDGVNFTIYVVTGEETEQIFSSYIDPKENEADQHWQSYMVDLNPYAGQAITLIFETSSGPAGNNHFDWAGWGEPRLVLVAADQVQAASLSSEKDVTEAVK